MSHKITIYSCTLMIINVDSCMYNIIQCSSYFIHLDPSSSFIKYDNSIWNRQIERIISRWEAADITRGVPSSHRTNDGETHMISYSKSYPNLRCQEKRVNKSIYPLVNKHSYGKSPSLIGKSTINGPCSIAM